jgi:hypothetical protein
MSLLDILMIHKSETEERLRDGATAWTAGGKDVDERYLAEIDRLIASASRPG